MVDLSVKGPTYKHFAVAEERNLRWQDAYDVLKQEEKGFDGTEEKKLYQDRVRHPEVCLLTRSVFAALVYETPPAPHTSNPRNYLPSTRFAAR